MNTSQMILNDYFVNFINWHPDTLAEEKSIDGELQGHIIHFEVEYKGKIGIFGRYRWNCEYKPSAWQTELLYYATDKLEFEYIEGEELKIVMNQTSEIFAPDEFDDICNSLESIIEDTGILEETYLINGVEKGSVLKEL